MNNNNNTITNVYSHTNNNNKNHENIDNIHNDPKSGKILSNYIKHHKMNHPMKLQSEILRKGFILQSWTKLVRTKFQNPVNSRNGSVFQIPNFSSYPPISMLNLAKFCYQEPKTLRTTLIWVERDFVLLKNRFCILSQQFCSRLQVIGIF